MNCRFMGLKEFTITKFYCIKFWKRLVECWGYFIVSSSGKRQLTVVVILL